MSAAAERNVGGTRAKARAVLGALSLMVLGGVIGVAVDRHMVSGERHASPAAALHELTMSSLDERLDLTADQRRQIDSIVGAHHESLRYAWQAVHAQLGAAIDTVHREIEGVLTADQRTAFLDWLTASGPDDSR